MTVKMSNNRKERKHWWNVMQLQTSISLSCINDNVNTNNFKFKNEKKTEKKGKMNRQSSEIQWMALFFKNKSEM